MTRPFFIHGNRGRGGGLSDKMVNLDPSLANQLTKYNFNNIQLWLLGGWGGGGGLSQKCDTCMMPVIDIMPIVYLYSAFFYLSCLCLSLPILCVFYFIICGTVGGPYK